MVISTHRKQAMENIRLREQPVGASAWEARVNPRLELMPIIVKINFQ